MSRRSASLGPLSDGQTVAVIGGGPGGIGCALALQREAVQRGRRLRIVVFEGKRFGAHYNQCAGVLSPPLLHILKRRHGLDLPVELIEREIHGYVVHSDRRQLVLSGAEHGGASLAVRRVLFDEFLEAAAVDRGIEIVRTRVTDLEFHPGEVVVFSWSGTLRAAVVVGAFGLSRAMTATLARRTAYAPPQVLETMVTNLRPAGRSPDPIPHLLADHIHVFLPAPPRIEFGALIPKGNHVTVIIAGNALRTTDLDAFLALPSVRRLIPAVPQPDDYFKGRFPVSLARGSFGPRYVTVGDAAGLVRPFKGKGINSAMITGELAAHAMMETGVSAEAFRAFYRRCRNLTGDLWYGRLVRQLARLASRPSYLDRVLRLAQGHPPLREVLFDCVSGRDTYRRIVRRRGNLRLAARLGLLFAVDLLPRPRTPTP